MTICITFNNEKNLLVTCSVIVVKKNVNSHSDSLGYHGESIPIEAGRCLSRSGKSFWHSYPTHEGDPKGAMRERLRRGIVSKCG